MLTSEAQRCFISNSSTSEVFTQLEGDSRSKHRRRRTRSTPASRSAAMATRHKLRASTRLDGIWSPLRASCVTRSLGSMQAELPAAGCEARRRAKLSDSADLLTSRPRGRSLPGCKTLATQNSSAHRRQPMRARACVADGRLHIRVRIPKRFKMSLRSSLVSCLLLILGVLPQVQLAD